MYCVLFMKFHSNYSISGSSATVYAYLVEFHNETQRDRAIMGSAIIYGVSCLFPPVIAFTIINQDWEFDIAFIDITYKPWRLFVIVCGLPGLFASIAMLFLPESPKFILGMGNKNGSINVLKQMNRWNNGENSELDAFDIYEESESIQNRRRILDNKNSRFPLIKSVWSQTSPLFSPSHLRSTLLICTVQFGIYATSNGFYMFFAEIFNRMARNLDSFVDVRIGMCDVINMNQTESLQDSLEEVVSLF